MEREDKGVSSRVQIGPNPRHSPENRIAKNAIADTKSTVSTCSGESISITVQDIICGIAAIQDQFLLSLIDTGIIGAPTDSYDASKLESAAQPAFDAGICFPGPVLSNNPISAPVEEQKCAKRLLRFPVR